MDISIQARIRELDRFIDSIPTGITRILKTEEKEEEEVTYGRIKFNLEKGEIYYLD